MALRVQLPPGSEALHLSLSIGVGALRPCSGWSHCLLSSPYASVQALAPHTSQTHSMRPVFRPAPSCGSPHPIPSGSFSDVFSVALVHFLARNSYFPEAGSSWILLYPLRPSPQTRTEALLKAAIPCALLAPLSSQDTDKDSSCGLASAVLPHHPPLTHTAPSPW